MNDTIYRRDAIQSLVDTEEIKGFAYRILEDRLMEIPSADRPQGEWEYHSNPAIGINPEDAFCSYCKYHIDTTMVDFDDYNFCPNCGARMFAKDINAPNKKRSR